MTLRERHILPSWTVGAAKEKGTTPAKPMQQKKKHRAHATAAAKRQSKAEHGRRDTRRRAGREGVVRGRRSTLKGGEEQHSNSVSSVVSFDLRYCQRGGLDYDTTEHWPQPTNATNVSQEAGSRRPHLSGKRFSAHNSIGHQYKRQTSILIYAVQQKIINRAKHAPNEK